MRISWIVSIPLLLLVIGCKKDEKQPEKKEPEPAPAAPKVYTDYYPFNLANYWIYQRVEISQQGDETLLPGLDSVYVARDTNVRGNRYWITREWDFVMNRPSGNVVRDSLDCIVDVFGHVLFSSENFSTVFRDDYAVEMNDTVYHVLAKMNDKDLAVRVAAGTFTTSAMEFKFDMYPKHRYPDVDNPRSMVVRYARDVGVIVRTEPMYISVNKKTERRLVRYHVE